MLGRGGTQGLHTCLLTQATLPSVLVPLLTDQKRGRPSPAFMASVQPDPSGPAAYLAQPSKASPFPCGLALPSLHSPLRVHRALLGAMPRGDAHPALPILELMGGEGGTRCQVHWGLGGLELGEDLQFVSPGAGGGWCSESQAARSRISWGLGIQGLGG